MVAFRLDYSRLQQLDANSTVYAGGKLYIYANLTTTLKTLYSDRAGGVTAANPIVADSAGRFPVRYVATDDLLTVTFKTSADVTVWSDDDIEPAQNADDADLADYLPLAGGTMTGALNLKEGAAIASAATVNLDSATGNYLHITGTTGISAMTLAAGVRVLIFDAACTLTNSANLILPGSANITTAAGDVATVIGEGAGVTRMIDYRLANGRPLIEPVEMMVACSDETTNLTTGTAKVTFRMPFAMTLDAIPRASLSTAQASGSILTFDINESGTTILSTKLTIDNNELTSETAATPAVLSDTALADDAQMTVDIDQVGTAGARGLKILLRGYRRNRS